MFSELLRKWFKLEPIHCEVCEVLRDQLAKSERERRELLERVLAPPVSTAEVKDEEEFKPITPAYTPWRVRQAHLEAEDREAARLKRDKAKEIESLEKELGVSDAAV